MPEKSVSDLRERLASAICKTAATQTSYPPGPYLAGIYADAVIRELNLELIGMVTIRGYLADDE